MAIKRDDEVKQIMKNQLMCRLYSDIENYEFY